MRLILFAALASTVAAGALAGGAVSLAAAPKTTEPNWLKKPTAEDLLAVWPTEAARKGIGGKARIKCVVTAQGSLRECQVLSESPPGAGFGAAAIALTPQFLMKPATRDGVAVAGEATIPISFDAGRNGSMHRLPQPLEGFSQKVITRMPWMEAPSVADVRAALPASAREKVGRVTLDCRLNKEGRLVGCNKMSEEPDGAGLAKAAKALAAKFRGAAEDQSGVSLAGAHVHVPFTFAPELANDATPLIGKPDWAALPQAEDIDTVAPVAARRAGVLKARVVIGCTVGEGGFLKDCKVISEDPSGHGYDRATLALAQRFRLGIWSAEGLPVIGGRVNVPVRYDLPPLPDAVAKK